MSSPFVAEIRVFPFNFAPTGWAKCNGQLIPISQNTALFSLLGTFYGGDGKSTFALPDMQGNAPMHWGQGPGLSQHELGEHAGAASVTLLVSEIPAHTHVLRASSESGTHGSLTASSALGVTTGGKMYSSNTSPQVTAGFPSLPPAGGDQPHNNMAPYLTLNFCIALQGVFPQRP